ncbi:hypothetical protein [Nostoc sp.]|uniref:hypothetical protein n=1 Tax=Nostoc sp. TaxID=1180 RepID=UPI002FFB540A
MVNYFLVAYLYGNKLELRVIGVDNWFFKTQGVYAPIKIDLPVIIQSKLQIQPTKIDFGSIEGGKTTETQTFVVRTNISGTAKPHLC